jgi:iron uptake system EfeUOB component EfeO/EfeM
MRSRPVLLGAAAVVLAAVAIVAAALSPWSGDDPRPRAQTVALSSHAAPGASSGAAPTQTTVFGTSEDAQQAAEDVTGRRGEVGDPSELVPLPVSAFDRPIARWRAYAVDQGEAVVRSATDVVDELRAGDRSGARAAWARAYTDYLRTGLAYGALGDLDDRLAASPGGLPKGTADPGFGGLHRVEQVLWTDAPLTRAVPAAERLVGQVQQLPHAIRTLEVEPLDYATRAHEILEDIQRDQLSGVAPQWSKAGVAATAAGVAATDEVIATLRPLLDGRGSGAAPVQTRLDQLNAELDRVRRAHHGTWPSTDQLSPAESERLDGMLGATLETLSQVPGELETARPPIVKTLP